MTISMYEITGIAGIASIMVGLVHSDFVKVIDLVLGKVFLKPLSTRKQALARRLKEAN